MLLVNSTWSLFSCTALSYRFAAAYITFYKPCQLHYRELSLTPKPRISNLNEFLSSSPWQPPYSWRRCSLLALFIRTTFRPLGYTASWKLKQNLVRPSFYKLYCEVNFFHFIHVPSSARSITPLREAESRCTRVAALRRTRLFN